MKRSELNQIIESARALIHERGFFLPPFAAWSLAEWRSRGSATAELIANGLGWDITDFGSGNFAHQGLMLFTVRNGHPAHPDAKPYAEKLMIVGDGQLTPLHFHWRKIEDIINRGGGVLKVRIYHSTSDEQLDRATPVEVSVDGMLQTIEAGGIVALAPGESITLQPGVYHEFWGEGGQLLVGEVSSINDDATDNRFFQPIGRFPTIEEDEPVRYPLVRDHAQRDGSHLE
jgi:D-lyxose ketol-isomerase